MKKVPDGTGTTHKTDTEYGGLGYKDVGMTEQGRREIKGLCLVGPTREDHTLGYLKLCSDADQGEVKQKGKWKSSQY